MQASTAIYQLKTMPEAFLRNNLLIIAGGSISQEYAQYYIETVDPWDGVIYNEAFRFSPYQTVADDKCSRLSVQNVRMIQKTEDFDHTKIPAYNLNSGMSDIMITGQLSGCAFAALQTGSSLLAAHIQPGGNRGSGSELRSKIKNEGRFKDHPNTAPAVFGIGDYQGYAYVIGVRSGSQWQLFGQIVSTPGPGANIIDVVKIV